MQPSYWQKQTHDKPLYPDLIWDRPENRHHAGKLLIAGGNSGGFATVAEAYGESIKAGVGTARAVLPHGLMRTLRHMFPGAEYAPETPSGSFAREGLGELLGASLWADGVLLPGDLGRNSETAILVESFVNKYHGVLTLAGDAVDYFLADPVPVLERADTTLVVTFAQLQKIASSARFIPAFTSTMPLLSLVEALSSLSAEKACSVLLLHEDAAHIAVDGHVVTTPQKGSAATIAAHAAVWRLQMPSRPLEALASALAEL
jgi:hypothetical protein